MIKCSVIVVCPLSLPINRGLSPIVFPGGDKADHLYGGAGDDTLFGQDGIDWLEGGADNNELFGIEAANDNEWRKVA
jgi:Ca2+-binding RTX toxin-like protein